MRIAEIWRYPVKSMAGERLDAARISFDGMPGDRLVQVHDASGRIVTSRTRHLLLGLRGTLGADGEPLVNGLPWRSSGAAEMVRNAAGAGVRLVRDPGPGRFDVLPLLVGSASTAAVCGPTSSSPVWRASPSATGPGGGSKRAGRSSACGSSGSAA